MATSEIVCGSALGDVGIEVVEGDITAQADIDAIVNPAGPELTPSSSISTAIHLAAGSALGVECRRLAPVRPGCVVVTQAHGLPNQYVMHCVPPSYGRDEPVEELLAACYWRSIQLAERQRLGSLAFPAFATRSRYLPVERCARVAGLAVLGQAPSLRFVRRIRFVLRGGASVRAYRRVLADLCQGSAGSNSLVCHASGQVGVAGHRHFLR